MSIGPAVRDAAERLGLAASPTFVAVSGGVDSTVLLHALVDLELPLVVGHVNHGLRGAASDADEAHVKDLAQRCGLALAVRRVTPEALREAGPSRSRPTLQEAARRVRYDALFGMAAETGCARVATGHHLDDQAETVVLRLLRGASGESLGGMPEVSGDGRLVRPLLAVPRAEIERFARERGLSWREDSSNRDDRYARARLRNAGWARIAADLNPKWLRAVGDLAEAQRRDNEWIAEIVEQEARQRFLPECREGARGIRIDPVGWDAMPDALARRLARRLMREDRGGRDVSRQHILRVVEFLRTGRVGSGIELPGGRRLERASEAFRLVFAPGTPSGASPTRC